MQNRMLWFMAANAVGPVQLTTREPAEHVVICGWTAMARFHESCGGAGFERLLVADVVEKVEDRTTKKISRKSISDILCCCIACKRHYGGRDRFWMNLHGPS